MSKRIEHLVEVIEEIFDERERSSSFVYDFAELRRGAVSAVAERHQVDERTVADKFIRQLRPQISSTAEFDHAVKEAVRGAPDQLLEALRVNLVDGGDAQLILQLSRRLSDDK